MVHRESLNKPHRCISRRVESVRKKVAAYSPEFTVIFLLNRGLNFMEWLIDKAFLTPSVEQLLGRQADS